MNLSLTYLLSKLISFLLQRKVATAKEPKPSIETETKQEESKENAPNNNDIKKAVSEEVSKPVPRAPPPPPSPDVSKESKFTAERMYEYQWPPDGTGEFYLLRHQVCQFLETENLEEKYSGQFELQI